MKEDKKYYLIDSNILIDCFTNRDGSIYSKEFIKGILRDSYRGIVASKQITDIYYVLKKYDLSKKAKNYINVIIRSFVIAPTTIDNIETATRLNFSDYEDAVLANVAKKNKAEAIITNNPKHFDQKYVKAITPREFLKTIS